MAVMIRTTATKAVPVSSTPVGITEIMKVAKVNELLASSTYWQTAESRPSRTSDEPAHFDVDMAPVQRVAFTTQPEDTSGW